MTCGANLNSSYVLGSEAAWLLFIPMPWVAPKYWLLRVNAALKLCKHGSRIFQVIHISDTSFGGHLFNKYYRFKRANIF